MSNSHIFLSSGFPRAPLANGLGRYVCQLKRVTLKFCKSQGGSQGMREFIESELVNFATKNPGVVVYVKPRRHRSPNLTAEYLNGNREVINVNNFSKEEIYKWLTNLLTKSGRDVQRYRKLWHTDNPSIQGVWSPFTHQNPEMNVASFPLSDMGPLHLPPTATDQLIEMFKKQQLESNPNQSKTVPSS